MTLKYTEKISFADAPKRLQPSFDPSKDSYAIVTQTRLDTLDEITPENPVPRDAPSSDETPPPPQTTPEQKNETTIPSTESALQSAA